MEVVSCPRSRSVPAQPAALPCLLLLTWPCFLPGDITAAELGQVMRELGLNPSDAELRDLVNEADLNNDGVISFEGLFFPLSPLFLPGWQLT